MEDLLADFSDLIVSKDPNEDISAGGGEADAATTKETEGVQSSADAVNSHTQGENTSLPVLPKGSKIKMLLADLTDIQEGAETWEASDSIKVRFCFIISAIAGILLKSQEFYFFFSKILVAILKNSDILFGSDYTREN